MDYSRIRRWLEDKQNPCDLELDVLPALKRVAKITKSKVRGWGYFEPAVLENRDRRLAGLPEPKEFNHEPDHNNTRNYATGSKRPTSSGIGGSVERAFLRRQNAQASSPIDVTPRPEGMPEALQIGHDTDDDRSG